MGQKVERWSRARTRRASKPLGGTFLYLICQPGVAQSQNPLGPQGGKGAWTPKWPHSALLLRPLKQLESDKTSAGKNPAQTFTLLCGSNSLENLKHLFSPSSKTQLKDLFWCFPTDMWRKVWKSQYLKYTALMIWIDSTSTYHKKILLALKYEERRGNAPKSKFKTVS